MAKRRHPKWDPVADWDGLVTAPNHMLITAEQMQWNANRNLGLMERSEMVKQQDAEANATPVGGMQFRGKRG